MRITENMICDRLRRFYEENPGLTIDQLPALHKKEDDHLRLLDLSRKITGKPLLPLSQILDKARSLKCITGIYFLIHENEVVYVGQSTNVYSRVGQHAKSKEFDSFTFLQCPVEHLDDLESLYIFKLGPSLNSPRGGHRYPHQPKLTPLTSEELLAKYANKEAQC